MSDESESVEELETAENPAEGEGAMGVLDHLEELRFAILKSMGGFFLGVLLTGIFFKPFFQALKYPLDQANAGDGPEIVTLTSTSVMGVYMVVIQVCLIGGIAVGLPFVLYHFSRFVAPGLTEREKRVLAPACACTLILFVLGALFCYFVVLPIGLHVTLIINKALDMSVIWTAQSYYGLVVWMMVGVGLSFEFPLILVILQYIGVVTPQKLRDIRRYMVVFIMVLAAVITPSDLLTMLIMTAVMYLFYEAAIFIGDKLVKKREAELEEVLSEEE